MGISTIDVLQVLPSPSRRRIISTVERLGWVAESRTCLCGDPPTSSQSGLLLCQFRHLISLSPRQDYYVSRYLHYSQLLLQGKPQMKQIREQGAETSFSNIHNYGLIFPFAKLLVIYPFAGSLPTAHYSCFLILARQFFFLWYVQKSASRCLPVAYSLGEDGQFAR